METPVFEVGEMVKHKLGFKGLVHRVVKEIRNADGTILQELTPEDYGYNVGYMAGEKMEVIQVGVGVLEKYVE